MASSISQPGCRQCGELGANLACGLCISRHEQASGAVRKRREVVKRASKRAGAAPQSGSRRVMARCEENHYWSTSVTAGRDDEVDEPQCPMCGKFLAHAGAILGEYAADVECTDHCKNAKDDKCRCSCAGTNHGIYLGKFKYVKTKSRR